MKTDRKGITRVLRAIRIGAGLGAAVFGVSTLHGQNQGQYNTTPPPAMTDTSIKISHRAKEFLQDAAQANQMEITLADVAQEKSQNNQVRELATMLRTDHQMNYSQLQGIAGAHGVTLDASLTWMNQRTVSHLQKANPADFDKEYTKAMLKDHVACIKSFDNAAVKTEEQDIKQYVENTLPTLRSHLMHSEKVARAVGVEVSTISSILKELPEGEVVRGVTFNQ
jgi:putative membrane protein